MGRGRVDVGFASCGVGHSSVLSVEVEGMMARGPLVWLKVHCVSRRYPAAVYGKDVERLHWVHCVDVEKSHTSKNIGGVKSTSQIFQTFVRALANPSSATILSCRPLSPGTTAHVVEH